MARHAILAMLLMLAGVAPAAAAQRSWMVTGFDRIAVGGNYEVTVTVGKGQSVRAEGAQRDLDRIDVRVTDRQLRIQPKDKRWTERGDSGSVRIWVTVPALTGASLAGSGRMDVDRVKATRFDGSVAGTGAMKIATLQAETVRFQVAGSGALTAAGRCNDANLSVAGSSEAHVGALACQSLTANVAGSGEVDAHASRTAKLSVMGSGSVRVKGGAKCQVTKLGSGDVDCG